MCLQSDSSLTVVENTEAGEGAGSDEPEELTVDFGDAEVATPSEDWQTLKPGNTTGHTGPAITSKDICFCFRLCVCARMQARQCQLVPMSG